MNVEHLPPIPANTPILQDGRRLEPKALAEAIRTSQSWAEVMRKLGYSGFSGSRYSRAKLLAKAAGLDSFHLPAVWNKRALQADEVLPFSAPTSDRNIRTTAIGEAVSWFLRRGYTPSIPVEPTRYDLVVESDDDLKKIQVKTTTLRRKGLYQAEIGRQAYAPDIAVGSNGHRARTPYKAGEVDLFFIVTGYGDKYLIPLGATNQALVIALDRKYAAYRVESAQSTGGAARGGSNPPLPAQCPRSPMAEAAV